jgi:pyruvate, orthophosphate dikinase
MTELRDFNLMQSDALTRNLDLTRVEVIIPEFSEILEEAVRGYAGKEQQAKDLLREYHHQYRNWQFVVQETWRYATSNLRLYSHHQLNGSVVYLLSQILFEALRRSQRFQIRSLAVDYLIGFWLKLTDEIPEEIARPIPDGISLKNIEASVRTVTFLHEGIVRYFFQQLGELREAPFESLMRCYYQPKRLAAKLVNVWPDPSSFEELRALMERLQKETYKFWLLRDDPCKWAMQQERELSSIRPWSHLCYPLSHEHYLSYLKIVETEVEPESDHRKAV